MTIHKFYGQAVVFGLPVKEHMSSSDLEIQELLSTNVSDLRFVAFDTETTGRNPSKAEMVEIAAVAFDEEFEHRRFESFVKPLTSIPKEVVDIHGITDEMVADASGAEVVLRQFSEFLGFVGQPRVLLAHNAAYDVGILHGEGHRRKVNWTLDRPEIVLDTCTLAKILLPDLERHSLGFLVEKLSLKINNKLHRAIEDVMAVQQLFMHLLGIAADQLLKKGEPFTLLKLIELNCGYFLLKPSETTLKTEFFRYSERIQQIMTYCGHDKKIKIVYNNLEGETRYITPLNVRQKGLCIYVEAFCHEDQMKKTFRGDRILRVILESSS